MTFLTPHAIVLLELNSESSLQQVLSTHEKHLESMLEDVVSLITITVDLCSIVATLPRPYGDIARQVSQLATLNVPCIRVKHVCGSYLPGTIPPPRTLENSAPVGPANGNLHVTPPPCFKTSESL